MPQTPITILDRAPSPQLEPFPYVVVRDALPSDYYKELSEAFPKLSDLPAEAAHANNKRIDLLSSWGPAALGGDAPAIWKQFISDHCSEAFRGKVFNLFPFALTPEHHVRTDIFGSDLLERLEIPGPIHAHQISGRATLAVNTPVRITASVRGPHVDSHHKAYVGLFYLRHEDDDSEGGDLSLYRVRPGRCPEPWSPKVAGDDVEQIDVVRYAPNTLIMMLNTSVALHGVTRRQPTPHMRRLVVVSGWLPGPQTERFSTHGIKTREQY